ncbi:histidine kinase [Actinoplanes sp. TRM 88003]|uniref:histidine kinase n=1 Tax=Paractinoplanes aksuensis TaxID=2939490 RepID=A0ABT1DU75_9ACTN|nr:histidine kinase [Actinoplanes aksuensis]MCO8274093.1 histidine kinase [Actinoplanes aksuensis]
MRTNVARWRRQAGLTERWRLAYEVALVALVTVAAVVPSALVGWYPAAPWLVGLTTPVLLLLRLTHPLIGYVAAALVGLGTGGPSSMLLLVLSASLAYRVAHWWQVGAGLAAAWVGYVLSFLWEEPLTLEWTLLTTLLFALLAVLPAGVARLVRRRRVLLAAMHGRNVQLHSQQSEIARQAQARERARIARDMHDSLGHKLTLISLYSSMMRTAEDPDETADLVRKTSSAAMTELRQILGLLGQDDPQSLVRPLTGLDELAEQARSSGARVELLREGEPRPEASLTEHAAYRVIQEGLTNALRHAQGGAITLRLRYEPDALIAAVTNTAGLPVVRTTSKQGLLGLAERVRVAGGMLYHGPTPDGGFRVAATLPHLGEGAAPAPVENPPPPAGPDFADVIDRHRRRSRFVLVATALSIAVFLALCGVGMWLISAFATVDRETYDAARIGAPEHAVRETLPDPDAGTPAADAACVDYQASIFDQVRGEDGELRYRFCFRDGMLSDKQIIREPTS